MSGSLYFDWVVGDGVSIVVIAGNQAIGSLHLSARESRLLAKRLGQWQDYKDARGESRPCRQPANRMKVEHVFVEGKPL
ncbi:hypothetical protein [Sphingomonas parapaucimobilis]|uniref:Uncharacterized protein n=1 Tax=Sphingomonas parapaucimobilis NBRC 15100 TaxID=1219049 RepID=A0A0A1W5N9_9SPHN|nr:hypothetical protein [Sphingomonas parapaucimobilis]GAM00730.1 hypothetical protein SP5_035_01310 [Sphingomonas parapaucimobilis NBRC 15100]